MRVLLVLRPKGSDNKAEWLAKLVDAEDEVLTVGNLFYVSDLRASIPIHDCPEVSDKRADAEYHFVVARKAWEMVKGSWDPYDCTCGCART